MTRSSDRHRDRGALERQLYTIDPRGLGGLSAGDDGDPARHRRPEPRASTRRACRRPPDVPGQPRAPGRPDLGFAAVNTNDFNSAFARIVKDNSAYYVLGYYPPGQRKDGRFHKLEVQGAPAWPRRCAQRLLDAAHQPPQPLPGRQRHARPCWPRCWSPLPIRVPDADGGGRLPRAVAKDNKARVVLTVELSGEGFKFTEKNGVFHDVLDLSVLSVDASGSRRAEPEGRLDLKPRTHQIRSPPPASACCPSWKCRPARQFRRRRLLRGPRAPPDPCSTTSTCPTSKRTPLALSGPVLTSVDRRASVPTRARRRW